MLWGLLWFALAVGIGALAAQRERSGLGWFVLALLISPVLAGLLLLLLGSGAATKRCPACRELVRADAVRCKHCGEDLTTVAARQAGYDAEYGRKNTRAAVAIAIGLAVLFTWMALARD